MLWTYASEKRFITDPFTGRQVTQLTQGPSNNVHFYFTENSFTLDGRGLVFVSDRETAPTYNLFYMDTCTGIITRLTDYLSPHQTGHFTKTPEGRYLFYSLDSHKVMRFDTQTGENRCLYTVPPEWKCGRISANCDQTQVAVLLNERVDMEHGINYSGFQATMYAIKRMRVIAMPFEGGEAGIVARDTHEGGHLQFSPDDPNLAMYCHEGPWHLVHQRVWLLNVATGEAVPCFRQGAEDCVGHEYWTRDGQVFIDNRRKGHDGTITSHRTQAIAQASQADPDQTPYISFCDKAGRETRRVDLPHYCNHYHGDSRNSWLVGDEVDDLVKLDLTTTPPTRQVLVRHGTSWRGQHTHCHPTVSWDDAKVLYASDQSGSVQLYWIDC